MSDKNLENLPDVSVVIPLYNEAPSLIELTEWILDELTDSFNIEIIFVDDGSTDDSWEVVKNLSYRFEEVQGTRLQRNYGKSTALQVGFEQARGEYVATLDADLQDDPAEIPEMIAMMGEDYDLISGWKKERKDPLSKTIPSKFFNWITSLTSGIELNDFNCGLKVYRKRVVKRLDLYGELHRFIPLLAKWEGYNRIGEKAVKHHPRKHGNTKFGLSRFMHGFLDLVSLLFINNYLQRPMHFFGSMGVLLLLAGGGINTYLAAIKIFYGASISGRPLLMLGILFMVLGVQLFSIGFLGELINKQQESTRRPNIEERVF